MGVRTNDRQRLGFQLEKKEDNKFGKRLRQQFEKSARTT